jgi:hypothetical protein
MAIAEHLQVHTQIVANLAVSKCPDGRSIRQCEHLDHRKASACKRAATLKLDPRLGRAHHRICSPPTLQLLWGDGTPTGRSPQFTGALANLDGNAITLDNPQSLSIPNPLQVMSIGLLSEPSRDAAQLTMQGRHARAEERALRGKRGAGDAPLSGRPSRRQSFYHPTRAVSTNPVLVGHVSLGEGHQVWLDRDRDLGLAVRIVMCGCVTPYLVHGQSDCIGSSRTQEACVLSAFGDRLADRRRSSDDIYSARNKYMFKHAAQQVVGQDVFYVRLTRSCAPSRVNIHGHDDGRRVPVRGESQQCRNLVASLLRGRDP